MTKCTSHCEQMLVGLYNHRTKLISKMRFPTDSVGAVL